MQKVATATYLAGPDSDIGSRGIAALGPSLRARSVVPAEGSGPAKAPILLLGGRGVSTHPLPTTLERTREGEAMSALRPSCTLLHVADASEPHTPPRGADGEPS